MRSRSNGALMRDLRGRIVVITGAASGIGRATALRFVREGARVAVCDVDDVALAGLVGMALTAKVDVADVDAVKAFAERVVREIGVPDVVVNNAGVGVAGPFVRVPLEDFRWIAGVNLWGAVHVLQAFLPGMLERGDGHVVNVVSALGYFAPPGVSAYVTTKYALLGLTESLRAELGPRGIGVSAVCPGVVDTGIVGKSRVRTSDSEATRGRVAKVFARGRSPEGVADAVIDCVRRDRGVRPVFPEAWALWYLKRLAPDFGTRLGRWMLRKVTGSEAARRERDAM